MKGNLLDYFSSLKDTRINRRKLHPLINIIAMTIIAVMGDNNTWNDIHFFVCCKEKFFRKFLDLQNGIPSVHTFRRVFQSLDPKELEICLTKWAQSIFKNIDNEIISIDGKTIRQASKMNGESNIHLVSAWASENEITLGQVKTEIKSNEIKAIPELLNIIDYKNSIITIDAMGCQKEIANKIAEKAEYVLALKENHSTLYQDVIRSFEKKNVSEFCETLDYGHGRIENRKCSIIKDLNYLLDSHSWRNLQSIVKIESERIIKKTGEIQKDTRYYLSSLTDVQLISKAIRKHWGVENKLHWCLDIIFNEDYSSKRVGYSAQNFAIINKIVLNVLHKDKQRTNVKGDPLFYASLRVRRKLAGWDDDYMLSLLSLI
jgi:predicted transposase YbfD/YdcC